MNRLVEARISACVTHTYTMSEINEIRRQFSELQQKYNDYLPKVDPALVHDLLLRQAENPGVAPIYMLEVFTKQGVDTESARDYIYSKTGMSPAIFDNGTHYATNQKLTLEMLKEISDSDDVVEITGEYTERIWAYPVSHEHGRRERRKAIPTGPRQVAGIERPVEAKFPTIGFAIILSTAGRSTNSAGTYCVVHLTVTLY